VPALRISSDSFDYSAWSNLPPGQKEPMKNENVDRVTVKVRRRRRISIAPARPAIKIDNVSRKQNGISIRRNKRRRKPDWSTTRFFDKANG
jgi:hypothetical protein